MDFTCPMHKPFSCASETISHQAFFNSYSYFNFHLYVLVQLPTSHTSIIIISFEFTGNFRHSLMACCNEVP